MKTKTSGLQSQAKTEQLLELMTLALGKGGAEDLKQMQQMTVEASADTKKIIIPLGMSKLKASNELRLQHENEEQVVEVNFSFEGWNWKDVLVAVKKVSEETFGWINGITERTFFGTKRPKEIDVITDVVNGKNETEKCFFGKFEVAAWEDAEVNVYVAEGTAGIQTTVKKKFSNEVTDFYKSIEKHLKTSSIYRGKTIVITEMKDPGGTLVVDFEIIENQGEDKIILNEKEELVIDRFIVGALEEKGKRCYLFTGDYGTGKTETAMRVGRDGVKKGMTFFYCKQSNVFEKFLAISKRYQPCIVFLEDVDEIGGGDSRDTRMNSILNTLDGVQTKGNDITVIFTTNHEQKINPALRRPGRIDLIVRFEYPDDVTKKKIYEQLLDGVPGATDIDYDDVVLKTPAVQGAVIAQICERAKKLAKREGSTNTGSVIAAIASMEYQIQFMKDPVQQVDMDKVALDHFAKRFSTAHVDGIALDKDTNDKVTRIKKVVGA